MLLDHIGKFLNKIFLELCQHIDLIHNQNQLAVFACSLPLESTYSLCYLFDSCLALYYNFRSMEVLIPPQL